MTSFWHVCTIKRLAHLISLSFSHCAMQDKGEKGPGIARRNSDSLKESPADKVADVVGVGKVRHHSHRVRA